MILHETLPDCQEKISWSMPMYWKGRNVIHFAAMKSHLGIYPGPETIEEFSNQLQDYKTTKGAIQFPYKKGVPYELVTEIVKCAYQNYAK